MGDTIAGGLLIAAIFAVVVLIFGGWVLGNIARAIGRGLGLIQDRPRFTGAPAMRVGVGRPPPGLLADGSPGFIQCRVPGCRHFNPTPARFCRHCGHAFPVAA